ncbi:MAG TPA: membrane protein insertase YidC [Candidatus Omnitrophota bacterium]|nr:membrane protein insertase YidC [Candidatus Omnitrophota bacterium]
MDKNTLKAIVLSAVLLFVYPLMLKWFYPAAYQKPVPTEQNIVQKTDPVIETKPLSPAEGSFIEKGETPATTLFENALYRIEFSTLGGTITSLSYLGEPERRALTKTEFFTGDPNLSGIFGVNILHEKASLAHTVFKMVRKGVNNETLEFFYELPGEYQIIKTYTMHQDKATIDLLVRVRNLSEREKNMPIELNYGVSYEEGFQKDYGYYDAVTYSDKLNTADLAKVKKKGYAFPEATQWSGFIKKYFALLIKPDGKIVSGTSKADEKNLTSTVLLEPLTVPAGSEAKREILIYAGPQRYEVLKSFGVGFESVFSRGFFGLFKTWLLLVLKFLNQFTHNFGWALVILTLLIKLIFAPLTHISYSSMKKMQALAPKQKAIQERYKKDPAKAQQEVMALYRRNKVNPMMGCLPMLIQIPVFIAIFRLLPEAIEFHGAPFIFWIKDLSAPDHFLTLPFTIPILGWDALNILPILMAASQVWYQKIMPQQPGSTPEQATIMNLMPIFFGFMCYTMPSGLTLYWFLQNIFSIAQQVFINKIVVVLHHEDAQ